MLTQPPLIIVSGTIGSGKGTILHALTHELPLVSVPTHTTRPVRRDDAVLSHRIFDTDTNFMRALSRGEFVEATEIAGYRYGLLRADLEQIVRMQHPAVVEVSIEGGLEIARQYPNSILLFITAPEAARRKRIAQRQEAPEVIETRIKAEHREEKLAAKHCDYLIENAEDHPEEAIEAIKEIIQSHFPQITPAAAPEAARKD